MENFKENSENLENSLKQIKINKQTPNRCDWWGAKDEGQASVGQAGRGEVRDGNPSLWPKGKAGTSEGGQVTVYINLDADTSCWLTICDPPSFEK